MKKNIKRVRYRNTHLTYRFWKEYKPFPYWSLKQYGTT